MFAEVYETVICVFNKRYLHEQFFFKVKHVVNFIFLIPPHPRVYVKLYRSKTIKIIDSKFFFLRTQAFPIKKNGKTSDVKKDVFNKLICSSLGVLRIKVHSEVQSK